MNATVYTDKPELVPAYGTDRSAAFDICASETVTIPPGGMCLIKTGVVMRIPPGHFLLLAARSSLARKKQLMLANGVGIVDEDYCGPKDEICAVLYNFGDLHAEVREGERIMQGMILPVNHVTFDVKRAQDNTDADRGGFGSTGGYTS